MELPVPIEAFGFQPAAKIPFLRQCVAYIRSLFFPAFPLAIAFALHVVVVEVFFPRGELAEFFLNYDW
jgi:hypothetical protein